MTGAAWRWLVMFSIVMTIAIVAQIYALSQMQ